MSVSVPSYGPDRIKRNKQNVIRAHRCILAVNLIFLIMLVSAKHTQSNVDAAAELKQCCWVHLHEASHIPEAKKPSIALQDIYTSLMGALQSPPPLQICH